MVWTLKEYRCRRKGRCWRYTVVASDVRKPNNTFVIRVWEAPNGLYRSAVFSGLTHRLSDIYSQATDHDAREAAMTGAREIYAKFGGESW